MKEKKMLENPSPEDKFKIGLLVFPGITQLDLTGPYEVFARAPGTDVRLVWKDKAPVLSDTGLALTPHAAFAETEALDLLCVPGGPGINDLLSDEETLDFVRHHARHARYITSVCTGALLLGAAGVLKGKRATTHWMSLDLLEQFGCQPVAERTVQDGQLITGGGVTAGIDFALAVVGKIHGQAAAEKIQLSIQYDPKPPFTAGSPEVAPPDIVKAVREAGFERQEIRRQACERAASRLHEGRKTESKNTPTFF